MDRRPRARWLTPFALCVLWQAWRLLLTPHGIVSTWTSGDAGAVASLGGAGIAQEFLLGADGLDGIRVRVVPPEPGSPAAAGQALFTWSEVLDEAPSPRLAPLQRGAVPAGAVTAGVLHLPLREIRASRGHRYRLTLQHVGHGAAPPLRLQARADDAHPAGRFFVDGEEQWGDLLFETTAARATLPYWKDEVLGAWPGWLRSWPGVIAVLLLGNVLLARAWRSVIGASATQPGPRVAAPGAVARASLATAMLVLVAVLTVAAWPVPPLRTVALADHLADARIASASASLHEGIAVQPVAFSGRARRAIVALPPARLAWTIDVPRGALFQGDAAMRADVWDRPSDGVNLRVWIIDAAGAAIPVAAFTLVPFQIWEHRGLHPFRVSLDPWAGQRITLVLETDPERWGNAVNDVPIWVEPRIVWPRGRAWGDARIGEPPAVTPPLPSPAVQ